MTIHQDNATRMARIAQILAVVVVLAAIAAFLIPVPAKDITTGASNRPDRPTSPDGATTGTKHFRVTQEDWLIALAPLSAHHNPTNSAAVDTPPIVPGQTDPTNPENQSTNNGRLADRPPIRYLGHIGDANGLAALIEFAGRQTLLQLGQEFEENFEITRISEDEITVSDGFDEFTFTLAQSNLSNALPTRLPSNPRTNPNAFPPGGRTLPNQPGNPVDRTNPRKPGSQNDDDGGSPA